MPNLLQFPLGRLAALLVLGFSLCFGATPRQPLFETEEPLVIRLEAPFATLEDQKEDKPDWLPGKLILQAPGDTKQVFDIEVRARGNFRRKSGECDFPTYWLNFKKKQLPGTIFENQDKLKVVAHCQERESFYNCYVHREYLVYKTYNILTEASFQVRLARIEYVYTDRHGRSKTRPAFLIEHPDHLAGRLGGSVVEREIVPPVLLDPAATNRADLFEFMIGNTDYDLTVGIEDCCHNSKVIAFSAKQGGFIPIPYDFDISGLVNPPYAIPDPRLKIDSVTERAYRGLSVTDKQRDQTLALFRKHKDAILRLWKTTTLLDDSDKKQPVRFLEEFFELIDQPAEVERKIHARERSVEGVSRLLEKEYPKVFKEWQLP